MNQGTNGQRYKRKKILKYIRTKGQKEKNTTGQKVKKSNNFTAKILLKTCRENKKRASGKLLEIK